MATSTGTTLTGFVGTQGSGARYFAMTFAMRHMGSGCTRLVYLNPSGDTAAAAVFAGGGAKVAMGTAEVGETLRALVSSRDPTCVIMEGVTGVVEHKPDWWSHAWSLVTAAATGVSAHHVLVLAPGKSGLLDSVFGHKPPVWAVRITPEARAWLHVELGAVTPGFTGPDALKDARAVLLCPSRGVCVTPNRYADPRLENVALTAAPTPLFAVDPADDSEDDMFTKTMV